MPFFKNKIKFSWQKLLNYRSVVKQLPFVFFLTVLAVMYIYNGHLAYKTGRKINAVTKEIKELEWEFKTLKSDVLFMSTASKVAAAVREPLELKELNESPYVLKDTTTQDLIQNK
jgi:cell division protein FtsL